MWESRAPEPPDQTLRKIGVAIREARRQHGLTQMRLEALSGVDQTSISRLERGLAPGMKVSRLARILAALPRSGLLGSGPIADRDIWVGLPVVIGHREPASGARSQSTDRGRLRYAPIGIGRETE